MDAGFASPSWDSGPCLSRQQRRELLRSQQPGYLARLTGRRLALLQCVRGLLAFQSSFRGDAQEKAPEQILETAVDSTRISLEQLGVWLPQPPRW